MEIVEHVEDIDLFIKESSKFLKRSGVMFVATLNKTLNLICLLLWELNMF